MYLPRVSTLALRKDMRVRYHGADYTIGEVEHLSGGHVQVHLHKHRGGTSVNVRSNALREKRWKLREGT